jgi:hypothetical protein
MPKSAIVQAKQFIFADIEREIALADASQQWIKRAFLHVAGVPPGGGNLMIALALLSYTEYGGRLKNNDFSDGTSRKNFNDFFSDLGPAYKQFLAQRNAYKIFRCGLAHEYYVKKDCVIAIRSRTQLSAGIGHNGTQYFFVIQKYFEDFRIAFEALCAKIDM